MAAVWCQAVFEMFNTRLSSRSTSPLSPKDPIIVPIDLLRPTQAVVGMRAVAAKRERLEGKLQKRRRILRFLEKRPIPAVRGPGNGFYIVDHHHLSLALWQSDVDHAFVEVINDLSRLSPRAFWRQMSLDGRVYPFDETGRKIPASRLPRGISELRSDIYRDLAWSVREEGGFEKTRAPYSEFIWAEFFRDRISARQLATDYEAAVERAIKLARSKFARGLPGAL